MLQAIIWWLAIFPFAWALVMIPIVVVGVTYGLIKESIQARKQRQWEYKFANPYRDREREERLRYDPPYPHTKWTLPSEDQ